jgi:hypothetical protein
LVAAARRDEAQARRDARKRRADKFEELFAALYEFDHWLENIRLNRVTSGSIIRADTVSPLAKVQSISSVYFPQFDGAIVELESTADQYYGWSCRAGQKRLAGKIQQISEGFEEVIGPYMKKREALFDALRKFAHDEFQ